MVLVSTLLLTVCALGNKPSRLSGGFVWGSLQGRGSQNLLRLWGELGKLALGKMPILTEVCN